MDFGAELTELYRYVYCTGWFYDHAFYYRMGWDLSSQLILMGKYRLSW